MKIILVLLLLCPTFLFADNHSIIRDRSGSVLYTTDKYGNQIIYRDRSGSVVATEDIEDRRDRRDRRVPLAPLLGEEED